MKNCLEDSPTPVLPITQPAISSWHSRQLTLSLAQGDTSLWYHIRSCVPIDHCTPWWGLQPVLTSVHLFAFDILILSPPWLWVSQKLHFRGTLLPSQPQKEVHWNLQQGSVQNCKIFVCGAVSNCVGPIQMQVGCLHMENIIFLGHHGSLNTILSCLPQWWILEVGYPMPPWLHFLFPDCLCDTYSPSLCTGPKKASTS